MLTRVDRVSGKVGTVVGGVSGPSNPVLIDVVKVATPQ
jgi:hypothetical protein